MGKKTRIPWDPALPAAENARTVLPGLAAHFLRTGDQVALAEHFDMALLHQFRLETKRFRYTLELFRPCYGPALEARIDSLRQVQDLLGEMNDCAVTRGIVAEKLPRKAEEARDLRKKLKQRAYERIAAFRELWRQQFSGDENQAHWVGYFSRYAWAPSSYGGQEAAEDGSQQESGA